MVSAIADYRSFRGMHFWILMAALLLLGFVNPESIQADAASKCQMLSWEGAEGADVFAICKKAAEQGDAYAQNVIGISYVDGRGVQSDPIQAVAWFRKAAAQDFALAQTNMGFVYATGFGVNHDTSQAKTWWRMAAEQGDPVARDFLGIRNQDKQTIRSHHLAAEMFFRAGLDYLDIEDFNNARACSTLIRRYMTDSNQARQADKLDALANGKH